MTFLQNYLEGDDFMLQIQTVKYSRVEPFQHLEFGLDMLKYNFDLNISLTKVIKRANKNWVHIALKSKLSKNAHLIDTLGCEINE